MVNHKIFLQYSNACYFRNRIWFIDGKFKDLFSINLADFSLQLEGRMTFGDEGGQRGDFTNLAYCCHGNKIFIFLPMCNQILVYDTKQGNTQSLSIGYNDETEVYDIAGIIQDKNYVWIFPFNLTKGIFLLDLETLEIRQSFELDNALQGINYICNTGNVIKISDTEIAVLSGKNMIIGINLLEKKRIFCKYFDSHMDIWGIRYHNGNFWLLTCSSTDVYEWIKDEDRLVKYSLLDEEWIKGKGVAYVNMIFVNNQIILLPCCLKYIMKIDKGTRSIRKAADYPDGFRFFDSLSMYSAFLAFDIIDDYRVVLHPFRGNMLLVYDTEKNQIEGKLLSVRDEDIPYISKALRQRFRKHDGIGYETDIFGMESLELAIWPDTGEGREVKEKQVGKKIYDTLKL